MEHTFFRARPAFSATFGAYLLAASLVVFLWAGYQGSERSFLDTTSRRVWAAAVSSGFGIAGAVGLMLFAWFQSSGERKRDFWFPLALTSAGIIMAFTLVEAGLRIAAEPHAMGARVGRLTLLPYDWAHFVSVNKELLQNSRSGTAYFVEDPTLGWTIAPSASTPDGLYHSSTEGLRSSTAGVTYLEQKPAQRIALFGNSFVFSEEVGFEDSLGLKLEELLAGGTQVLNAGVPGYGVDQALLRLRQQAGQLQPRLAILSFIQDDLNRNVNIYTFLKTDWRIPMSKPRFVVENSQLRLLNSPTLDPDDIFSRATIFDLPLLDHEIQFYDRHWSVHPLHASYIFRYLISAFPTWPTRNEFTDDDAIAGLGERLIEEFFTFTRSAGIVPLAIYLPSRGDYSGQDRTMKDRVLDITRAKGLAVHDLTECCSDAAAEGNLFLPGRAHYSGLGNAVVAACLQPLILEALAAVPRGAQ